MICPYCQEAGEKSCVYPSAYGFSTAMYCQPYYDEEGKYHNHDSNSHSTPYTCSKGHSWTEIAGNKCQCGWGHEATRTRHEDLKPAKTVLISDITSSCGTDTLAVSL